MFIAPLSQYGQSYYLKKVNTSQLLLPQYQNTYPRGPESMYINWNIPFQTQIYLVNVPLNVNIVKQNLLNKKQFLKNLWREVWKGGFQLMQILGLLGMYFDAVVVEVEKFLLFFFKLALAILCSVHCTTSGNRTHSWFTAVCCNFFNLIEVNDLSYCYCIIHVSSLLLF